MRADVTYAMSGFFPMKIVSLDSDLVSVLMNTSARDRFIKVSLWYFVFELYQIPINQRRLARITIIP